MAEPSEIELAGPSHGLPRGLYVLGLAAFATIATAGLKSLPSIGPILLALVLVVIAWPAAAACRRVGLPGAVSLIALLVTAYGIMVVMFGAMAWAAAGLAEYIADVDYERQLKSAQADLTDLLDRFGVEGEQLQSAIDSIDISTISRQAVSAFSGVLGVGGTVTLVVLTVLFMVLDSGSFVDRFDDSLSASRPDIKRALSSFASATRSYYLVSTAFGFLVAVLNVIALMVLNIPLAITWGVLSFITNYIPNIGFVIGVIPPAIIALLEHGWKTSLLVVIIYFAINTIIQTLVQPKIVGDAMGISATITFVSLIFWSWVVGPIGSLIAVPMTLLFKALLIDIDPDANWLAPLISLEPNDDDADDPVEEPDRPPDADADLGRSARDDDPDRDNAEKVKASPADFESATSDSDARSLDQQPAEAESSLDGDLLESGEVVDAPDEIT